MKKLIYIPMILALSISFVACGAKAPINANKATTNAPVKAEAETKITYTKELKYIPSYTGIKLAKYTAASKKAPFAIAKYTIKNTVDTKVFQDYQIILKKDGWTITQAKKSYSISAKKGTHIANIMIQKSGKGKDIILMIISK